MSLVESPTTAARRAGNRANARLAEGKARLAAPRAYVGRRAVRVGAKWLGGEKVRRTVDLAENRPVREKYSPVTEATPTGEAESRAVAV